MKVAVDTANNYASTYLLKELILVVIPALYIPTIVINLTMAGPITCYLHDIFSIAACKRFNVFSFPNTARQSFNDGVSFAPRINNRNGILMSFNDVPNSLEISPITWLISALCQSFIVEKC